MADPSDILLDTIVVGAGQAGLVTGYYLRRAGTSFELLEAGPAPTGAWPRYYASLRLFSTAASSALPGLRLALPADSYPTRDQLARYLTGYAHHFQLPVVPHARVDAVHAIPAGFRVMVADRALHARTVIAATGSFGRPFIPALPGLAEFRGELLHASAYRTPAPFAGRRVVVVGGGNSAVQIAAELDPIAHVTLASRRPIRFMPQRIAGHDVFRLLALTGVERLPLGHFGRLPEAPVVVDTQGYRAALARGHPDIRRMFCRLTRDGVVWPDGRHEPVDVLLFATGYRSDMPYLAPLGALDAAGEPRQRAGVSATTPGLFFVGLTGQRTIASATLRGVGPDAAYVVRRIRRYLRRL